MNLGLRGHVALVVGGTGLIGRAVVERLRTEGATAVAASRHVVNGITLDAQDSASVTAALEQVIEQHGRLDALVVAAAPSAQTLDASRHADPDQVLTAVEAKAMSFLRLANAALPIMARAGYGRIVGVSGQNAYLTGNVTGSVRNAALIIAAKNLVDSVAGSGVTVNSVSPGDVSASPTSDVELGSGGESSPEQIADLVAFLVSPLAGAVSGESIAIGHRVRGVTLLWSQRRHGQHPTTETPSQPPARRRKASGYANQAALGGLHTTVLPQARIRRPADGSATGTPGGFPLRRDAVIGGDVIMSKVVLDISRETRPLRRRSSTRADFPTSDASPEPYAGTPAPPGRSPSAARGRRPRPALTTGNS